MLLSLSLAVLLALGAYGGAVVREKTRPEEILRARVGEKNFDLELAETPEARRAGLGNRERLCSQCGMLFLFETTEKHAFWMKGMRFPLDIIWLRGERVVHLERSVDPQSQEIFSPREPANRVLELPAGAAEGLEVGETVKLLP